MRLDFDFVLTVITPAVLAILVTLIGCREMSKPDYYPFEDEAKAFYAGFELGQSTR